MSQVYYWRTLDHGAFLLIVLGLLGAVQIFLSFLGAFSYSIISPVLLAFVPLGVILVQAAATAILAEFLGSRVFPQRQPRGVPAPTPTRQYVRQFAIVLLAMLLVLGIWAGFYALIFIYSPWTPLAYFLGYTIANTAGALIALTLVVLIEWLLGR